MACNNCGNCNKRKTSQELYHTAINYKWEGGELTEGEEELLEVVGNSHITDESYQGALAKLVQRLHDDGLL